ncbi:hypothetical protein ACVRXQ_00935 [Streptococcus panodentis]|nr:hypothetical protein [Streptococcus panodentis]
MALKQRKGLSYEKMMEEAARAYVRHYLNPRSKSSPCPIQMSGLSAIFIG